MSGLPAGVAHRVSGRLVEVTDPLDLARGGRGTAVAVAFLRECEGLGLRVRWRPAGPPPAEPPPAGPPYDVGLLRHLPPPTELPGERAGSADWRAGHTPGLLYHRRGPDFISVLDRREPGATARYTLDHPDLRAAFHTLLAPTRLDTLPSRHREAAALLAAERLALVTDGWAVTLPPRVRRWPVPCTAI
ncbi:DUF5825 family protein [Streptomyces sp. NPDC026672]|uniref:DUF5825 family protein n=1 Tax=unclassified Streptomyces TaxID=2593676 RepID=UPI00340946A8